MKSLVTLFALGLTSGLFASEAKEIETPTKAPIIHQKFFRQEKELFGYKPLFQPNPVSFDKNNRPYIKTVGEKPLIQTMDDTGTWIELDFTKDIKKAFPEWNGKITTGPFAEERIVFDEKNNAFMIAATGRSNLKKALLMVSSDYCRSWKVIKLPFNEHYSLEISGTGKPLKYPPLLIACAAPSSPRTLWVHRIVYNSDGSPKILGGMKLSDDSLLCPGHSGGNYCISVGDMTYVVWPGATANAEQVGTPQYICSIDRVSGKASLAKYLGSNGKEKPDSHNAPVITADSQGILHVVMGNHHAQFKYLHSLNPADISTWSTPVVIGVPHAPKVGSYTYPALVCDKDDNLHIVARWAGAGYYFRLVYMRKKSGQDWEKQKYLVVPFRAMYACWYHKLALDGEGRLFLNYWFYLNQMNQETTSAYIEKWPNDGVNPVVNPKKRWDSNVKPHSPGMLMSSDQGDTWTLVVSSDFLSGIERQK